jgi:hypothetical protein
VSVQPRLAFEQCAKRYGNLPMSIAFFARRKRPRVAQCIAPQFVKFIQAVETLDERFSGSHVIVLAPFAAQRRAKSRIALTVGALNSMCVEPVLVIEQGAKQQRNFPVIISFATGRKRLGIAQNVAPMLNKFRCEVKRLVLR